MVTKYSVTLEKVINENGYEVLYLPCDASVLSITSKEVNRPGLLLAGADPYFDPARVQFLGNGEMHYINTLPKEQQLERLESLISKQPPLILITRNLEPVDGMIELAQKYSVPILRSADSTYITPTITTKNTNINNAKSNIPINPCGIKVVHKLTNIEGNTFIIPAIIIKDIPLPTP